MKANNQKKDTLENEIDMTEEELLRTIIAAHKSIKEEENDILKRKIRQNIEHELAKQELLKSANKTIPEQLAPNSK